jgi:hypothetical protein
MISAWTKHLTKAEEKEHFKRDVEGSKVVLNRLKDILKEVENDLDSAELNNKIYDIPNWDYRQAHLNGFRECLRKINKIINLDQQDK